MSKAVAKSLLTRNHQGHHECLVLFRSDTHPRYGGQLDLPGGQVDGGEAWLVGAQREIEEETGLIVATTQLTEVARQRLANGVTFLLYSAELDAAAQPIISDEHSHFEWWSAEQLAAHPLTEGTDPYTIFAVESFRHNKNLRRK